MLRLPKDNKSRFPLLYLETEKVKLLIGPSLAFLVLGICALVTGHVGLASASAVGSGVWKWLESRSL